MKQRLAVDFDNTIFDGINLLPHCIEVLTRLHQTYSIAIFSARATDAERTQMQAILDTHQVPYDEILERKPDCAYYIDDKAIHFEGWDKINL